MGMSPSTGKVKVVAARKGPAGAKQKAAAAPPGLSNPHKVEALKVCLFYPRTARIEDN